VQVLHKKAARAFSITIQGGIQAHDGGECAFAYVRAVRQTGLRSRDNGQIVTYEITLNRRTGKMPATNLRLS
jgi:CspA family cold shock protein